MFTSIMETKRRSLSTLFFLLLVSFCYLSQLNQENNAVYCQQANSAAAATTTSTTTSTSTSTSTTGATGTAASSAAVGAGVGTGIGTSGVSNAGVAPAVGVDPAAGAASAATAAAAAATASGPTNSLGTIAQTPVVALAPAASFAPAASLTSVASLIPAASLAPVTATAAAPASAAAASAASAAATSADSGAAAAATAASSGLTSTSSIASINANGSPNVIDLAGANAPLPPGQQAPGVETPYGDNELVAGPQTVENEAYKLRNIHKQHDDAPEWLDRVTARGFIGELYNIPSRDHQAIAVYHLINPLANPKTLYRYPMFINHGIGSDAAQMISHSDLAVPRKPKIGKMIVDPTDTSLAFVYSNNNYDVWMTDARGTNLNNHLVADDLNLLQAQKYWNFSLDEQTHNDLATVFDFVLTQTNSNRLHYTSFSESTFKMFALLSSETNFQNKLASFTALSPVAYVSHISGVAMTAFAPAVLAPDWFNGNYQPQIITDTFGAGLGQACSFYAISRTLCRFYLSTLTGKGDNDLAQGYFGNSFKGTSIKSVKHFMQLYAQKRFGWYDFGTSGNMRAYGQPTPPDYKLANIKIPSLIMVRGGNDYLSTHPDQMRLLAELGTKPYLDIYYPGYNHVDPLIGRNVVEEVNAPVTKAVQDWTIEWARRDGVALTRGPEQVSWIKPVRPVRVEFPKGDRTVKISSNLINNVINGILETTTGQILENDGGKSVFVPQTQTQFKNPVIALASKSIQGGPDPKTLLNSLII